jgi:hypothetical protein
MITVADDEAEAVIPDAVRAELDGQSHAQGSEEDAGQPSSTSLHANPRSVMPYAPP